MFGEKRTGKRTAHKLLIQTSSEPNPFWPEEKFNPDEQHCRSTRLAHAVQRNKQ